MWSHHPHPRLLLIKHQLVQGRQKLFYLAALHLVVEEIDVIEQLVSLTILHITAIASCYYADGSKTPGILVDAEVVSSLQYHAECVVNDIAVMQEVLEVG